MKHLVGHAFVLRRHDTSASFAVHANFCKVMVQSPEGWVRQSCGTCWVCVGVGTACCAHLLQVCCLHMRRCRYSIIVVSQLCINMSLSRVVTGTNITYHRACTMEMVPALVVDAFKLNSDFLSPLRGEWQDVYT